MTPIGDGVMVGLSTPNGSQSGGMVGIYMPYDTYQGFAFGYQPGSSGPALQSPAATPLSGWQDGKGGSTGNTRFRQTANPGRTPCNSSDYQPTANGTVSQMGAFSLGMGVNLDLTADFPDITPDCSSGTQCSFKLADAYFTTGLLFSWNPYVKSGSGKMSMSFAKFYDYYLADLTGNVTHTATPYLQAEYGLFTPASTPLIGKWTVFDLGAKYSNPISTPITIVDGEGSGDSALSAELDSNGIITTFAQFIPDVTGILSWSHDFTVYETTLADLSVKLWFLGSGGS